jgi:hypothetical protein
MTIEYGLGMFIYNTIVVLNNLNYIPNNVVIKGRYRDISVGIYILTPLQRQDSIP